MDHDAIHHQADNLLAVSRCRLWCIPERRQVAGQGEDSSTLVVAEVRWLFLQKTIIFLCEIALIPHRFLPMSLQAVRHETILGLDGPILPFGTFRLIGGPLQAVLPVAVQAVALLVHVLDRFQAELQGGGLQSTQDLLGHEIVHRPGFETSEFRVLAFLGGDEVGIISSYLTSS